MILKINIIILLLTITINAFCQEPMPEIIHIGDNAPPINIKTINGDVFNTKSHKGKVIYLNFFATWCGPCMKEMPIIETEIWKTIKHPNFTMLAIGREHSVNEIKTFSQSKDLTMPMAADTNRAIYSMFAPQMIPRNIVIDQQGKIIYSQHGYDSVEFKKMIALIIKTLN